MFLKSKDINGNIYYFNPKISAYEIACNLGFQGTEEEWEASLIGSPGNIGDTGSIGLKGEKGVVGDIGPVGAKGLIGDKGPTGDAGASGIKGESGNDGIGIKHYIFIEPNSSDNDDDTANINKIIESANEYNTIFVKAGTYKIGYYNNSDSIKIIDKSNIKIEFDPLANIEYYGNCDTILINNCKNIEIVNCKCISKTTNTNGISINNSKEISICKSNISNYNNSIIIGNETPTNIALLNIRIDNCNFYNSNNGIVINSGKYISIDYCYFNTKNYGIHIHTIDNSIIENISITKVCIEDAVKGLYIYNDNEDASIAGVHIKNSLFLREIHISQYVYNITLYSCQIVCINLDNYNTSNHIYHCNIGCIKFAGTAYNNISNCIINPAQFNSHFNNIMIELGYTHCLYNLGIDTFINIMRSYIVDSSDCEENLIYNTENGNYINIQNTAIELADNHILTLSADTILLLHNNITTHAIELQHNLLDIKASNLIMSENIIDLTNINTEYNDSVICIDCEAFEFASNIIISSIIISKLFNINNTGSRTDDMVIIKDNVAINCNSLGIIDSGMYERIIESNNIFSGYGDSEAEEVESTTFTLDMEDGTSIDVNIVIR